MCIYGDRYIYVYRCIEMHADVKSVGVVASSERMIVIALAGRQTHLIASLINGCVVENNKRVERK